MTFDWIDRISQSQRILFLKNSFDLVELITLFFFKILRYPPKRSKPWGVFFSFQFYRLRFFFDRNVGNKKIDCGRVGAAAARSSCGRQATAAATTTTATATATPTRSGRCPSAAPPRTATCPGTRRPARPRWPPPTAAALPARNRYRRLCSSPTLWFFGGNVSKVDTSGGLIIDTFACSGHFF